MESTREREKFTFELKGTVFNMYDISWKEKLNQVQMREKWILINQSAINYWNERKVANKIKETNIAMVNEKLVNYAARNYELAEIVKEFKVANFDQGGQELVDIPYFREYMHLNLPNFFEEDTNKVLSEVVTNHEQEFKNFLVAEFTKKIGYESSVELLKEMSKTVGYTLRKIPVKSLV